MKKVAVLTTLMDLPASYGLVPVILSQLKMLVAAGYTPGLFVVKGFEKHVDAKRVPEGVELKPFVPFMHLFDYGTGTKRQKHHVDGKGAYGGKGKPPKTNFDKQVNLIVSKLDEELAKYDVVITHDLVFQTWFVPHNAAIRKIAENHPEIRWIHWLHSGPSAKPKGLKYPHTLRHSGMPNAVWVSPNNTMAPKFAEMYDVPLKRIKTVYHVFDPVRFFDMHKQSVELIEKHDLYTPDVLCVWATRIDHPEGKGMFKAMRLLGALNKRCDAKMLFLNSWSNSPKMKANLQRIRDEAIKHGVPRENLVFSSEMGESWERGVPWKVVRDMMWIANVFIFPTQTETFSFAMLEAGVTKNLLVLNEDLGVMTELAGDRAEYIKAGAEWGGTKWTTEYQPDEKTYWAEKAEKLIARLGLIDYTCEHCGKNLGNFGAVKPLMMSRHVLKTYNMTWIWKNQLETLIEEEEQ